MRFASLGSGSKGNATLVAGAGTLVMIDCGFSVRQATLRLQALGVDPAELDAILVTHEHSDHSAGVAAFSRRYQVPVYLTHGTHGTGRCDGAFEYRPFNAGERFQLGGLEIHAVAVPHDAREPCQYRIQCQGRSLGVLTDLGSVTDHVLDSYRSCDALLLEFNHELELLLQGNYPPGLKRRVAGDWGHLSNQQASELLATLDWHGLRHLVVAHVSENNNCPQRTADTIRAVMGDLERVTWASQGEGFGWLTLD